MSWGLSDVKFLCVGHRGRFQLTYITRLVKIVAMNSSNCQGRHGKFTDNTLIPILIQVRDSVATPTRSLPAWCSVHCARGPVNPDRMGHEWAKNEIHRLYARYPLSPRLSNIRRPRKGAKRKGGDDARVDEQTCQAWTDSKRACQICLDIEAFAHYLIRGECLRQMS